MTSRDFAYWLQGLFELADPKQLDEKQTDLIRRHLAMVFIHEIDPSAPAEQQAPLNEAHGSADPAQHPLDSPTVPVPPKRPQPWERPPHGSGMLIRC